MAVDPVWGNEARKAAGQTAKTYEHALRQIAEGLARYESCERVLENHVKESSRVLAVSGNNRKPWYKRHELEITAGGGLVGASCSVPDFISGFFPDDSNLKRAIVCAAMIVMIGIGLFLVIHGWLRIRGVFTR